MSKEPSLEEKWYRTLTQGEDIPRYLRRLLSVLPSSPRCKMCNAPFKGLGGLIMRGIGRPQSRYNPRYCEPCEQFDKPGGAEVVITMLFADVRDSTTLAERLSAREFSQLMNRFYNIATDVLVKEDAMVDKLIGDEVIGLFIPGIAGPHHPLKAIEAARNLLQLTGHSDPQGPWLPVGVGVHTGTAFVGVVGGAHDRASDFTALGDNVNVAARLASQAAGGEILISDEAYAASGMDIEGLESRRLELKGKSETVGVRVMRVFAG